MTVRAATTTDRLAVKDVVTRAFGDDGRRVPGLVDALRSGGHVRSELVADVDGAVTGHVMLSRSWVDARRALVEVLVLSPLSVAPELHGRGLGTDLLAAAVDDGTTGVLRPVLDPRLRGVAGPAAGPSREHLTS